MGLGGWIAVDLDGTLAHYDGWKGADHIGAPIPAMLERVLAWLSDGRDVRIFTARVSDPAGLEAIVAAIDAWCEKHVGQKMPVTNVKDFGMIELWDDRAVSVETNTGRLR